MLPKTRRLNKEADIARILAKGRRVFGQYITLRYMPAGNSSISRAGFIVSKKAHNKPVVRNLIKRRLRNIVSKILPNLHRESDILLSAKSQAVKAAFPDLEAEVLKLLKQAGLLTD